MHIPLELTSTFSCFRSRKQNNTKGNQVSIQNIPTALRKKNPSHKPTTTLELPNCTHQPPESAPSCSSSHSPTSISPPPQPSLSSLPERHASTFQALTKVDAAYATFIPSPFHTSPTFLLSPPINDKSITLIKPQKCIGGECVIDNHTCGCTKGHSGDNGALCARKTVNDEWKSD